MSALRAYSLGNAAGKATLEIFPGSTPLRGHPHTRGRPSTSLRAGGVPLLRRDLHLVFVQQLSGDAAERDQGALVADLGVAHIGFGAAVAQRRRSCTLKP